jgi:hypothetical protein
MPQQYINSAISRSKSKTANYRKVVIDFMKAIEILKAQIAEKDAEIESLKKKPAAKKPAAKKPAAKKTTSKK